jgi:pimeloyl-ACP methyl ester carboxylesterase
MTPTPAGASPTEALTAFVDQRLAWSDPDADGLEHTTVEVPRDYADPGGERLTLAVSRRRATDPGRRRGILLSVNGGPGGDGGLGTRLPLVLSPGVAAVHDLIGLDPRGTGGSTRLHSEVSVPRAPFDSRPPDSLFDQLAEDMRERERGCARGGGDLREHITTRNTARDMDLIRAVLGEATLSFVGYAYGTYVGAVYGSMFPDHLDRSVLDSCVNPDWTWREQFVTQAEAVYRNVELWAAWTAARHGTFGLGDTPEAVLGAVEDSADAIARDHPEGVRMRTLFDGAVGTRATDRSQWDSLAGLVGELLATTAEADHDRTRRLIAGEGTWRPQDAEGDLRIGVLEAITLETPWPTDLEVYAADVRHHRARHPYGFGVLRAQPWVGAFRSFVSREAPTVIERRGYPVGLVVQADGDPFDRVEGGETMAARLGHRLVLVTDSGEHELYGFVGNGPLDALVERYLVEGVLPASDVELPSTVARPDVPADDRAAAA